MTNSFSITNDHLGSWTAVTNERGDVALLTVYDMCKAVQRDMTITDVRLLSKSGGMHGDFTREEGACSE